MLARWKLLVALAFFATSHIAKAQAQGNPAPISHRVSGVPILQPPVVQEPEVAPGSRDRSEPLKTAWSDGLAFTGSGFRIHVGGNAQFDSTWFLSPNSAFELPKGKGVSGIGDADAVFLRRVRLRVDGNIYEQYDFIVEYDFANAANDNDGLQPPSFSNLSGQPAPANIWMQVRDIPLLGDIRIGNQVKPIGMSNNTSQAFLPFIERADNMDAFYGPFDSGFALGVAARNRTENERLTWQYGIYRPAINVFGVGVNKIAWGARTTSLPIYEEDGERLLHLGFGTFNGELPQNTLRVRARPLLRNGPGYANPVLVDTGNIPGSYQYTIGPEVAAGLGRWTFQAEWTGQYLLDAAPSANPGQGTAFFHGGYAQLLYFLTGERQGYNKEDGVFGRVVPNRDLRVRKGEGFNGLGAWQAGISFSYLDLNDRAIQGGTVYGWTAGLNWFWNPNMKVQFNYIRERRDQPGVPVAWIDGIGVRAAFDF